MSLPMGQPFISEHSIIPLPLNQPRVPFSMSPPLSQPPTSRPSTMPPPLNQPPTYVLSTPMSQPPHFIPPHAGPSTSTTFIPTLGTQGIPCNYFLQGNIGVAGGQNLLPQSSGVSNRVSIASTNGGSTGIPNERQYYEEIFTATWSSVMSSN
ncbi:hypothetical protein ACH5RR_003477 [Cinchona calisaya]|uniref:Uncharacterized protein n=1 Tax=Cinchona calisaya TaxID=153742 RepID=A0ABD3AUY4_9GENT